MTLVCIVITKHTHPLIEGLCVFVDFLLSDQDFQMQNQVECAVQSVITGLARKRKKTLYIFLEANPTLKAILPGTIDESSILPILSRLEWLKFKHLSSTGHMLYCTF